MKCVVKTLRTWQSEISSVFFIRDTQLNNPDLLYACLGVFIVVHVCNSNFLHEIKFKNVQ